MEGNEDAYGMEYLDESGPHEPQGKFFCDSPQPDQQNANEDEETEAPEAKPSEPECLLRETFGYSRKIRRKPSSIWLTDQAQVPKSKNEASAAHGQGEAEAVTLSKNQIDNNPASANVQTSTGIAALQFRKPNPIRKTKRLE